MGRGGVGDHNGHHKQAGGDDACLLLAQSIVSLIDPVSGILLVTIMSHHTKMTSRS